MENEDKITEKVEQYGSDVTAFTQMRAEIDIQISTARAFPRSIKTFLQKAESLATASEEIAASCSYSVPRKGKVISGPTVRLAEIVCSTYGNIRAGSRVIKNNGRSITAQGICHDLESNSSVTIEVERKITKTDGSQFSEDLQTLTGNAASAIAFRNAVFKIVPSALVMDIYEKTLDVSRGTLETLPKRRDKAIQYFKSLGVKENQICDVLHLKKIEDIDLDTMSTLRGMVSLIKNGESTIHDLFDPSGKDITPEDKERERIDNFIKDAKTIQQLESIKNIQLSEDQMKMMQKRIRQLTIN